MKSLLACTSLMLAALLGGCVVTPAPYSYGEPVLVAPPPPRVEYYGAPPIAGQIWIGGYWHWTGHRHEWVPGRWESPRPGHNWVPHRWERDGKHWRQHGGRWEERHDRHDRRDRRGW